MSKILISGYFGYDNIGDEAILAAMVQALKSTIADVEIVALSSAPEITRQRYGIHAIGRYDLKTICQELKSADLFISGGGGLLQDTTGWKTIPYYLSLVALAKMAGIKTMFYAQGIGPIKGSFGKLMTGIFASRVDKLTVRDKRSANDLAGYGVPTGMIQVVADPVLALNKDGDGAKILEQLGVDGKQPLMAVSLRPWETSVDYRQVMLDFLKKSEEKYQLVLLPFHFPMDYEFLKEIKNELSSRTVILEKVCLPQEYIALLEKMQVVVGMRLHSLIFALRAKTPFIGISYDPKVERFVNLSGLSTYLTLEDISEDKLSDLLEEIEGNRDAILSTLEAKRASLEEKALSTAKMVADLIDIK